VSEQSGAEPGILSTRQRRFIAALLLAPSIRQAAAAARVSERSAWKYLADPLVKAELAARQDGLVQAAATQLAEDMSLARSVLRKTMLAADTADGTRIMAARGLLEFSMRMLELWALTGRVVATEQRLSELEAHVARE